MSSPTPSPTESNLFNFESRMKLEDFLKILTKEFLTLIIK